MLIKPLRTRHFKRKSLKRISPSLSPHLMAIPISHPLRGRSRLRPLNPLGLRPLDQLVVVFTLCNMLCQLLCQLLLDRLHLTTHHNRLPTSYPWLSMLKTSVHFYHSHVVCLSQHRYFLTVSIIFWQSATLLPTPCRRHAVTRCMT